MRIDQLEYLIEVVKAGSINAASKNLFVSQQSLNKSLRSLEEEIGVQVLNRTTKGVTLTDQGRKIYSSVLGIVSRYQDMLELTQEDDDEASDRRPGKINVHIAPMLNISVFSVIYSEYIQKYPRVRISCQEKYRDIIVKEVAENPNDIGFVLVPNSLTSFIESIPDNVELHLLKNYPIYMAMSPKHPLAHQKSLSLHSLSEYPVIVYEMGGLQGRHAFQEMADIEVTLSTNNPEICKELLAGGSALMYSFPLYMQYGCFRDYVHLPVTVKGVEFCCYLVVNKNLDVEQSKINNSFSMLFQSYL